MSFASRRLEQQTRSDASLKRHYGDLAKRIRLRLSVLAAVDNLDLVPKGPPDHCHRLSGDLSGFFTVHVSGNWRILFRPDGDLHRTTDMTAIDGIVIIDIVDYH